MISTTAATEFVPFGRDIYSTHPSSCPSLSVCGQQRSTSLTDAVKGICIVDCQESWRARQRSAVGTLTKEDAGEEELYMRDCTVVWSAGRTGHSAHVIKTFTVSSPIKDALWCSFVLPKLMDNASGETIVEIESGVCVVESKKVSMFTSKGHDYITSMPFQIASVWPLAHGLLFERCLQDSELSGRKLNVKSTPVWYSMLHPLDEVSPVISRSGARLFYVMDKLHQLVFTCDDPAIAVTYDVNTGQHSVWSIRRATVEEGTTYAGSESMPAIDISGPLPGLPEHANVTAPVGATPGHGQPSGHSRFTLSSHSPSLSPRVGRVNASPAVAAASSSLPAVATSLLNPSFSRTNPAVAATFAGSSPSLHHLSSVAGISRIYSSPSTSALSLQKFLTPPPLVVNRDNSPAALARSSVAASGVATSLGGNVSGGGAAGSSSANDSFFGDVLPPVLPDLCFEHMYIACTSPSPYVRSARASKVFVSTDLVGQRYLCLLLPSTCQLWCFKFDRSNDAPVSLIFGASSMIPAKDAAPVTSLNMTLVLDPACSLVLYSGGLRVVQVHVPNTATLAATPMPFKRIAGSTPGPAGQDEGTAEATPARTGTLATSSRPPSSLEFRLEDEVGLLSPVQTELNESAYYLNMTANEDGTLAPGLFTGIKDCVNSRITLHAGSGVYCTAVLPQMSNSALVTLCIKAIANSLSRDVVLTFLSKWYLTLNSPGRLVGTTEWELFQAYLLESAGFGQQLVRPSGQPQRRKDVSPEKSPVMVAKRARTCDEASAQDWQYLLMSELCRDQQQVYGNIMDLTIWQAMADERRKQPREQLFTAGQEELLSVDFRSPLASHAMTVFFSLHLAYEELKLSWLQTSACRSLAAFLLQIAWTMKIPAYVDAYYRDFPGLVDDSKPINIFLKSDEKGKLSSGMLVQTSPPSLFAWLLHCMQCSVDTEHASVPPTTIEPFPYIPGVCNNICHVVKLHAMARWGDDFLTNPEGSSRYLRKVIAPGRRPSAAQPLTCAGHSQSECNDFIACCKSASERVVLYMVMHGLSRETLVSMPCGVSLPLWEALLRCRDKPPPLWPAACYRLIGREDLAAQAELEGSHLSQPIAAPLPAAKSGVAAGPADSQQCDGMESISGDLLHLRFGEDLRIKEVMRCLQSSLPVHVAVVQRPEVSDHEFIEERERHLLALCQRTMAIPLGRGAFTLHTYEPMATEALVAPRICLTGRAPPRNITVDLSHIDVPPNMAAWPQFHNGVASGLRVVPSARIDSAWILYNRPKAGELANEHAGFLMALGLNGHLPKLATMNMHDYLIKGHEMTSIGVLLGLAASRRASMDLATVRLLGIHVPALLPPTSTELDIPHNVQVAALLGVGLVYQGTAHRHIAEVLLDEIDRPPGPDTENSVDRESYSLAAGLALGMTMLCKGNDAAGLADLNIPGRLFTMVAGGHRGHYARINDPLLQPGGRARPASCAIKEGDTVNTDVTSPGAMLALGLIFFNSCNSAVGDWLAIPDTQFLLEFIRPDFLLLRAVSHSLVFWDRIQPSEEWIEAVLPPVVSQHAFQRRRVDDSGDIDYETMSQAYCSLVAGACMSLGLRFAGSCNQSAFKALMKYVKKLLTIMGKPSLSDQAGKACLENCLVVCVLSLAMVMAGSGSIDVLRVCRHLRARPTAQTPTGVVAGYGSHMAIHLAIGLLFLGGGRSSLCTTPEAVAVMLCAFFPKFPSSSNDNRYHLQAFRHLYVLATEQRALCPREVDTSAACHVPIEIALKATKFYRQYVYTTFAPCLLPEIRLLEKVTVLGPRYWPVEFNGDKGWKKLRFVLNHQNGTVYVKQRAGHLPYSLDPVGYRSKLSQALLGEGAAAASGGHLRLAGGGGSADPVTSGGLLRAFAANPAVLVLVNEFLAQPSLHTPLSCIAPTDKASRDDSDALHPTAFMSMALAECLTTERLDLLPVYLHLEQVLTSLLSDGSSLGLWQLMLVHAHAGTSVPSSATSSTSASLMSGDLLQSVFHTVKATLEASRKSGFEFEKILAEYMDKGFAESKAFYKYLLWFRVPSREVLVTFLETSLQRQRPLGFVSVLKMLRAYQSASHSSAAAAVSVAKEVCEVLCRMLAAQAAVGAR